MSSWRGVKAITPPLIDGVLDDSIWQGQSAISEFRQVEPVAGEAPSQETHFYFAYDSQRLYFAVSAFDSEVDAVVATQKKRDADLSGDDNIVLVIDPFLDKRNGYYFSFNALGARRDALIRGGVTLNTDWDGIWDVVAQRTSDGWVAEGSIPISTISFDANAPAWGFNIERFVARTGERIRWNGTQRQYLVNNLANAGRLTGLTDLRRASGFEVRSFATVTYTNDRVSGGEKTSFEPGFDIFYKLTESTTAVLTVNTDFADAEVDDRVVNLTRFPVKFPEKRAFFLQDAGVFSYSLINNNPLPYYSRRIGLGPKGEVVDIKAGARLSGREGPINFGILGVSTAASGDIEAKELGVARVQWTLTDETNIGTIATYGDPRTNGDAWLVGFDLNHTTGQFLGRNANLLDSSLYFQRTGATDLEGDSDAYGWGLIYDSPTWGFVSYMDRVGEDYYPAMGSVRQTGVYTVTGKVDYEFNPESLKSFVPNLSYVRRYSLIYHDREQETFGTEFTAETQRGDTLLVRFRMESERLPEAFRVGKDVMVQPGDFTGNRFQTELAFSKTRPLSATLGYTRLPFYGGTQDTHSGELSWRPSPMFNLEAAYDYTAVKLPYAAFPVRLIKIGATVQFSKELVWSTLSQYDNISETVGFNTRLRWTYAPGGDVFLVFNQGVDVENDRWEYTRSDLSAKVGGTFRF